MKSTFILFVLAFVFQNSLFSQACLPNGIIFSYQSEIDNFQSNYPGCTEIEGDVVINGGPSITNLNGLNVLQSIGGSLTIYQCYELTSLTGLDAITQSVVTWILIGTNH